MSIISKASNSLISLCVAGCAVTVALMRQTLQSQRIRAKTDSGINN